MTSFKKALEHASATFAVYALSLISAFSWNSAVQDFMKHHQKYPWQRWVYAAGVTLLALVVITLILVFHDDEL